MNFEENKNEELIEFDLEYDPEYIEDEIKDSKEGPRTKVWIEKEILSLAKELGSKWLYFDTYDTVTGSYDCNGDYIETSIDRTPERDKKINDEMDKLAYKITDYGIDLLLKRFDDF